MRSPALPSPRRIAVGVGLALLAAGLTPVAASANPAGTNLVISEVYGGGTGSGAADTYGNDFIELRNPTAGDIDVTGWSVQYHSATGTGAYAVTPLSGVVKAGARYLVQEGSFATGTQLPAADDYGTINLSGTSGVVALVSNSTPYPTFGSTAGVDLAGVTDGGLVDLVGYGTTANTYETSRTGGALSSVLSAQRTTDADNNDTDFTEATPTPVACGTACEPTREEFTGTIAEIQGSGATSPHAEDIVTTMGVVTARYPTGGLNGFVIQTGGTGGTTPDATPGASDAIFVWGGSDGFASYPAIGASVQVKGIAVEGGGPATGLTEIIAEDADVTSVTPTLQPVTTRSMGLPASVTEREAHESELVTLTGTYTITNSYTTNQYGTVGLASGTTPLRQWTDVARPGTPEAQAVRDDNSARALTLDDGASIDFLFGGATASSNALPWLTPDPPANAAKPVRVGARASLLVPMIFEFRNNAWTMQPTTHVTAATDQAVATFQNTRTSRPENVGGDLKLATFNVLNYFNTTGQAWAAAAPARSCTYDEDRQGNPITVDGCTGGNGPRGAATAPSLTRQQDKMVRAITNMDADIVALEEIENSRAIGEEERDDAVKAVVAALNARAGYTRWAHAPSPEQLPATEDVIRTALIFNPDTVSRVGQSQILIGSAAFDNARQPLAQAFKPEGAPNSDAFAVVVNHFKSKSSSGSSGDNVDTGDGQGAYNGDRVRQANALVTFADQFAASRNTDKVFLTGDFNSYTFEDPMQVFYGAGYEVVKSTNPNEWSYSFSGLSGSLDHVLANGPARAMVTGADIWEIGANESPAYSYERFNNNVTNFHAATPYGASDHNPEVVGINTDIENIQVLGINDFHGRIKRDGAEAGAAVLAGAVKQLRSQNPDTVFAAAGDLIGASTFDSFIQNDKPTIDALNEAGLDVSAVGNHEFDQGYDDLVNRVMAAYDPDDNPTGGAEWKYLGANVRFKATGNPALPATWIKDFGDVEVGFVGAVTEHLPELVSPEGIEDIEVTGIVEATNQEADDLKAEGADIVILLVHEGASTTAYNSAVDPASDFGKIVNGVSADVDAIISGHTHLAYNHRVPVAEWAAQDREVIKRPVVSAGQYGYNLNQLRFRVDGDTGEILGIRTRIIALQSDDGSGSSSSYTPNYPDDAATKAIVDAAVAKADVLGARPLGKLAGSFTRPRLSPTSDARGRESTLGNLVAEVQRWATESATTGSAQIAFMNPGGLRADMVPAGDGTLTYRGAANVQPFANTLVNMDLSGAQIKSVLEQQWQPAGASRPFLRLGASKGFTYTYDPTKPAGSRITAMWLNGVRIEPTQVYSVTANSFLAAGGDNFTALAGGTGKQDTGKSDLQAMVDYLAEFANPEQGDPPLPVDYSQRAVGATFGPTAPSEYSPGAQVTFDLTSLAMTAVGDKTDSTVEVALDGTSLGSFPVDNVPAEPTADEAGKASVSVSLPASTTGGAQLLTVMGTDTGTVVRVPIVVSGGTTTPTPSTTPTPTPTPTPTLTPEPQPEKAESELKAINPTGTVRERVRFKVKVLVHELVSQRALATAGSASGVIKVRVKGKSKVHRFKVRNGKAIVKLPAFNRPGTKKLVVRYLGDDDVKRDKLVVRLRITR